LLHATVSAVVAREIAWSTPERTKLDQLRGSGTVGEEVRGGIVTPAKAVRTGRRRAL